jgi:hypothetical protein
VVDDGIQPPLPPGLGSSLYFPHDAFVSESLDDLHSLNLGTMSANVRCEEFMVTDHGIDKQDVAGTSRKRKAILIPRG